MSTRPAPDMHPTLGDVGGRSVVLAYGSVAAEYEALHTRAAVFDRSHRGRLRVKGPRAAVVLGTTMGEADVLGDLDHAWIHKGAGGVRRAMIPKYGSTLLPIHIARAIGSEGAVLTLPAACAAGNYAITGRVKDIINRGGVKFNPRDVEDLLDSHPKVLQSAIVPMPDPILGEKACVFVVLRNKEEKISLDDVVAYLLGKDIAKNKLPERLVVVAEMPLTPTRKIIKSRLRLPENSGSG